MPSLPGEQYRARSQSSVSVNYTPTLDEHEHYMGRRHKRELSECSSVGVSKMTITPSTTASNSPLNFAKNHLMTSQDKLDCIAELETTRSDDSGTESERDRMRQQQMMLHQEKMNMINSRLVRGHADGSVCGSSHHSLVSSVGQPSMIMPLNQHPGRRADIEVRNE